MSWGVATQNGVSVSLASIVSLSAGVTEFSPIDLFTGGVAGAWYDPSDYTTLFQDSAGTTPVTAVEQPVGLMLDKSQGLVLGSEAVASPLAGTLGASYTIVGDTVVRNGSTGTAVLNTAGGNPVVQDRTYLVQFTASNVTGDSVAIRVGNGTAYGPFAGNGTFTVRAVSGGTTATAITFLPWGGGAATATYSNISVKALPGNHASQSTSTSRPVLRARYNLLTYSEDYSNAVWVKSNLTRTTGVADPFGGTSATTLTASGGSGRIYIAVPVVANANYTGSFYIRRRTGTGDINWETFTVGVGALITVTGSWTRVTVTSNTTITTAYFGIRIATSGDEIDVFAADFRPGSSAGTYQRIAAATDYATAGFLPYLYFVTDDSFGTNSIDFSATDKMSVCAGVTKLSDAATAVVTELSATINSNNGSFVIYTANPGGSANYQVVSKGTFISAATATGFAAPVTNVLTSLMDISGDSIIVRANAAVSATGTGDQGTGNYGNYPLYIGRRNNASLPFNGNFYGLIVAGKTLSASELSATEAWMNSKTGAY